MKAASIGKLAESVKTWNPSREPSSEFEYIDLSAVDSASKTITVTTPTVGSQAPSRARQLVAEGDVLVSNVRPNLNAVAVVPPELDGATASTGFTVLRPSSELEGRFLFHWVRSPQFIGDMVRKATGASYPAVSDRIVKDSLIPAPSLPEQRRIAAILDHADALRAKRRQVLTHLDALTQSIFNDMFGDPRTWSSRWPMGVIGDMVESAQYGTSAKSGSSGAWPILRMGNITDMGRLDLTDLKYGDLSDRDVPKYSVRRGDLLFNRTNSKKKVGKTCVIETDEPLAIAGYLVRIRLTPGHQTHFVSAYLTSSVGVKIRQQIAKAAVNQANINPTEMQRIPIALPDPETQMRFANRVRAVEIRRSAWLNEWTAHDELFASLQSRAFRGEL